MEILRENRDSLVATLEAFVHDPLISWRLLNTKKYVVMIEAAPAYCVIPADFTSSIVLNL
jgi:phosphatidylinositol kinase/protein kinase (PI-3  family)